MDARELGLGRIIERTNVRNLNRDAVHIAVIPAMAGENLKPGQHVAVRTNRYSSFHIAFSDGEHVGLVDPLLREEVQQGQVFWLWVYPNKVTGLSHHWDHPAFDTVFRHPLPPVNQQGPPWRNRIVLDVCKRILEEEYWGDTVYLADALEDSGYPDEGTIRECREPDLDKHQARRLVCLAYSEETEKAVREIEDIAGQMGLEYHEVMTAAENYLECGDYVTQHGSENWRDTFHGEQERFWKAYETVNSCKVADHRTNPFSCSC